MTVEIMEGVRIDLPSFFFGSIMLFIPYFFWYRHKLNCREQKIAELEEHHEISISEYENRLQQKKDREGNYLQVENFKGVVESLTLDNRRFKSQNKVLIETNSQLGVLVNMSTQYADRVAHDVNKRYEFIRKALKEEEKQLGNTHLDYIMEVSNLHLQHDISKYVNDFVECEENQFNISSTVKQFSKESQFSAYLDRITYLYESEETDVYGNKIHFKIILENLFKNAFRHSINNTPVNVRVSREGDIARFSITNYANHLTEKQLKSYKEFGKSFSISPEGKILKQDTKGYGCYTVDKIVSGFQNGKFDLLLTSIDTDHQGSEPSVTYYVEIKTAS